MKFWECVEVLRDVWDDAKKTTYNHFTTQEKNSVDSVIDWLETLYSEVEKWK